MRASIASLRQPLIQFLGKRVTPKVDHSLRPHPMAPSAELPSSFAQYRKSSQTHGPLGRDHSTQSPASSGASNAATDAAVFLSISDLPRRFHYSALSDAELENINMGGAETLF